jgi:hypothetical protein
VKINPFPLFLPGFSALWAGTGPVEKALTKVPARGGIEGVFRTLELPDIAAH